MLVSETEFTALISDFLQKRMAGSKQRLRRYHEESKENRNDHRRDHIQSTKHIPELHEMLYVLMSSGLARMELSLELIQELQRGL